jgi:hypothetical protein
MSAVAVETPVVSVGQPVLASACAADLIVHVLFGAKLLRKPHKIWDMNGSWRYRFPRAIYELDPWL